MPDFQLVADFGMMGDQEQAVQKLSAGVREGLGYQTLLGVTGSGKTFTMANIVQEVQRPTMVMAHNKTLAAQLATEFKEFFPHNAVEYFVSYYDYYQPEAYVPRSPTPTSRRTASVNEELDKLRLAVHHLPAHTPRHVDRGLRFLHLRSGRPVGLLRDGGPGGSGRGVQPQGAAPPAHRHAVRAQRY